jgi:hypothetical protein
MSEPTNLDTPKFMKRSKAKIWIRTVILAVFGTLFGLNLFRDMQSGIFPPLVGVGLLLVFLPIGFWMRKLVPMQVHVAARQITFSFDKIYFILIWVLVIGKAISSYLLHYPVPADILMCIILGLMSGRLSGICLRVHRLKMENGFIPALNSAG